MKTYKGFFEATWVNKHGLHVYAKAKSESEAREKMMAMDCAHGSLLFVAEL